jgi:hypothetical protein
MNARPIAPVTYRIIKISDPRSRGACYWFEIESMTADGGRHHVATCDTREEAREMLKQLEAATAKANQ